MKNESFFKKYVNYFWHQDAPENIYQCFAFGGLNFFFVISVGLLAAYTFNNPLTPETLKTLIFIALMFGFINPFGALWKSKQH